jgi:hypothetical protein
MGNATAVQLIHSLSNLTHYLHCLKLVNLPLDLLHMRKKISFANWQHDIKIFTITEVFDIVNCKKYINCITLFQQLINFSLNINWFSYALLAKIYDLNSILVIAIPFALASINFRIAAATKLIIQKYQVSITCLLTVYVLHLMRILVHARWGGRGLFRIFLLYLWMTKWVYVCLKQALVLFYKVSSLSDN